MDKQYDLIETDLQVSVAHLVNVEWVSQRCPDIYNGEQFLLLPSDTLGGSQWSVWYLVSKAMDLDLPMLIQSMTRLGIIGYPNPTGYDTAG